MTMFRCWWLKMAVVFSCLLVGCSEDSSPRPAVNVVAGQALLDAATCGDSDVTCPGSLMPAFELSDFQPLSPGFNETYGPERFHGKVTVVALFASWCGYCRGQAEKLDKVGEIVRAEGKDINLLAINIAKAEETQDMLAAACGYPLLQDTEEQRVWDLLGGAKDDFYVYGSDGKLDIFLSSEGDVETYLSGDEGFANMLNIVMAAQ